MCLGWVWSHRGRGASDMIEWLERCEVEGYHRRQQGRSFYGLRRQATDLAPEFAQDARVLNRLTGHTDCTTRERVYQDPRNERVRARAAEARRSMRNSLRETEPSDSRAA
jgi:integrase